MLSQKLERRRGVFDCFRLIEFLVKLESLVSIFLRQLNAALHAPEQVGTQRDETVRGVPVGNAAHMIVDAEDLLKHDDAWPITARRQGKITVELVAIEGFNCWHIHRLHRSRRSRQEFT